MELTIGRVFLDTGGWHTCLIERGRKWTRLTPIGKRKRTKMLTAIADKRIDQGTVRQPTAAEVLRYDVASK